MCGTFKSFTRGLPLTSCFKAENLNNGGQNFTAGNYIKIAIIVFLLERVFKRIKNKTFFHYLELLKTMMIIYEKLQK